MTSDLIKNATFFSRNHPDIGYGESGIFVSDLTSTKHESGKFYPDSSELEFEVKTKDVFFDEDSYEFGLSAEDVQNG
jgi:hypothetical protein